MLLDLHSFWIGGKNKCVQESGTINVFLIRYPLWQPANYIYNDRKSLWVKEMLYDTVDGMSIDPSPTTNTWTESADDSQEEVLLSHNK